jgi:outer membrane receptor protein involved in Fe transport
MVLIGSGHYCKWLLFDFEYQLQIFHLACMHVFTMKKRFRLFFMPSVLAIASPFSFADPVPMPTPSVTPSSEPQVSVTTGSQAGGNEMVVQVKAKKRLIQNNSAISSVELNKEQISKLPQGQSVSLPKLLGTTNPGVVQGAFGQTFIRGNHGNVQYQVDGVQMPDSPSNTFGQAVSPRNIEKMEVITGGIPAEFGQRLSAVVNITTKSGTEKPSGEFETSFGSYNTSNSQLLYGGTTEKGDLKYFLSASFLRTDRGLDTPHPESYDNQYQGGRDSVHNRSTGHSQFLKMDWQATNENKVTMTFFNSQNNYQIPTFPGRFGPDGQFFQPGIPDSFGNSNPVQGMPLFNYMPPDTDNSQTEVNTYGQVVWKRILSEKAFLQFAPYYKYSSTVYRNDPTNDLASLNLNPPGNPSSFSQDRRTNNVGFKGDYTYRPSDVHLVKAGFQLQASRTEGNVSIETANSSLVDNTPNTGYFGGIYIQDDIKIAAPLVLNLGLRYDLAQYVMFGHRPSDSLLQPRLGLNYMVTESTKLHLFYGKLFQPAPVESLRYKFDPSNGTYSALEFYDIKPEKDNYYEMGVAQQFLGTQVAGLNVYYKEGVNVLDDAQVLNTSIAQPFNFRTGFAYGVELSLKGQLTSDWSHYSNYSYSIAKGKGTPDEPDSGYQMLDHVQMHTANLGVTYSRDFYWWSLQGLYGSGLRTGPNNSISLPGHITMDTTLGYEFHGASWFSRFKLSGDMLNIFDRAYPITIANGFNGSHYAVGRQYMLRVSKSL